MVPPPTICLTGRFPVDIFLALRPRYADTATADAALGGWQRSPGHNLNLLDRKMRRMGIAAADAPGTRFKTYWALMMTD